MKDAMLPDFTLPPYWIRTSSPLPGNSESTSDADQPGPHLGFCTGQSAQVELDVEARGLGLAWALFLFQMGPARPEAP